MCADFINLTAGNLAEEHLCCIIRSRKAHPGVETKRRWLAERLKEGHVFRKLDAKATVFVEYAPLEAAWVPIVGDNYIYIYSRGQRAKRTCSHVHLATAARVKCPDACIGVFDFLGDCQLWLSILKMYSCTGLTENSVFRFFKQCDESLSARL